MAVSPASAFGCFGSREAPAFCFGTVASSIHSCRPRDRARGRSMRRIGTSGIFVSLSWLVAALCGIADALAEPEPRSRSFPQFRMRRSSAASPSMPTDRISPRGMRMGSSRSGIRARAGSCARSTRISTASTPSAFSPGRETGGVGWARLLGDEAHRRGDGQAAADLQWPQHRDPVRGVLAGRQAHRIGRPRGPCHGLGPGVGQAPAGHHGS